MTLTEAQVDRWSRQIILPDVGGRGQERLLAAAVTVTGRGPAADHAVLLLERAGVGRIDRDAEPPARASVLVDLDGQPAALAARAVTDGVPLVVGRLHGGSVVAATLLGRPCGACAPLGDAGSERVGITGALVLGALAAGEVLRALWFPPPAARVHCLDLESGRFTVAPPPATPGCAVCRSGV